MLELQAWFFDANGQVYDIIGWASLDAPPRDFKRFIIKRLRAGYRVEFRYYDDTRIPCL